MKEKQSPSTQVESLRWGEVCRRQMQQFCLSALLMGSGTEGAVALQQLATLPSTCFSLYPSLWYSSLRKAIFPSSRKIGLSVPDSPRCFWVILHYKEKKKLGLHNNGLEWQVGKSF